MDAKSQVSYISMGLCSLGSPRLPQPMTERDYYNQRPFAYVGDDGQKAQGKNLRQRLAELLRHGFKRALPKG